MTNSLQTLVAVDETGQILFDIESEHPGEFTHCISTPPEWAKLPDYTLFDQGIINVDYTGKIMNDIPPGVRVETKVTNYTDGSVLLKVTFTNGSWENLQVKPLPITSKKKIPHYLSLNKNSYQAKRMK